MASVTFDGVSKVYDNGFRAVDDLDLEISDGEFMVLVGPSGAARRRRCGCSPASRTSARATGDRRPRRQRRRAAEARHRDGVPELRAVSAPDVYDNMAYGLKIQKLEKEEIRRRVREIAAMIGLEDLLERKPKALRAASASASPWAGDRAGAEGVPDGRTAVEPRRQAARADALGGRAHPARAQGDHRLRHPRPGRGDDDGRPRGAHAPGRAAAGRLADGALQRAGEPVRGELHRQPGDEPARGDARAHDDALVARVGDQSSGSRWTRSRSPGFERYVGRTVGLGMRPEHIEDATVETDAPPSAACAPRAARRGARLGADRASAIAGKPVLTEEVKEVAADLDDRS